MIDSDSVIISRISDATAVSTPSFGIIDLASSTAFTAETATIMASYP
jgi:hypothetical protein